MKYSGITIDIGNGKRETKVYGIKVKLNPEDGGGYGIKTEEGKTYQVFYDSLEKMD